VRGSCSTVQSSGIPPVAKSAKDGAPVDWFSCNEKTYCSSERDLCADYLGEFEVLNEVLCRGLRKTNGR
jgi:hypothetical protein